MWSSLKDVHVVVIQDTGMKIILISAESKTSLVSHSLTVLKCIVKLFVVGKKNFARK